MSERRSRARGAWRAALALACVVGPVGTARAEETCVECHVRQRDPRLRAPTEALPTSVHGRHQMTCSSCHGGKPDEPSVRAHDVSRGFRARFEAGSSPTLCGGCHADPTRVARPANPLPTDQLQQYLESVHGRAFARGNARAATCATCHGAHDVRSVDDPQSRVYPANVAATCGRCHSDRALAERVGLPHDQESQWRRSVHGRKYAAWIQRAKGRRLERDDRHPPTCNDCHQDHAAAERDRAVSGCQGCHRDMWQSFSSGPHRQAFQRMGFLPCVDCHGSHEIAPVDSGLIGIDREASCRRCHAEGQRMYATIRHVAWKVREAERAAERAKASLEGATVGEIEARMRPVDEARRTLRLAVHSLDPDRIKAAAASLKTRAERATRPAEPESMVARHAANLGPPIALGAVGLVIVLLSLRRKKKEAPT